MKTFAQVAAWCAGAAEEFGDPSTPVCQLMVRWHDDIASYRAEDIACGRINGEVVLVLGPSFPLLPMRLETGGPQVGELGELQAFGAEPVTPGVWAITPSLNAEGLIHAFLVLYGVPDPAPWDRRIVLP